MHCIWMHLSTARLHIDFTVELHFAVLVLAHTYARNLLACTCLCIIMMSNLRFCGFCFLQTQSDMQMMPHSDVGPGRVQTLNLHVIGSHKRQAQSHAILSHRHSTTLYSHSTSVHRHSDNANSDINSVHRRSTAH